MSDDEDAESRSEAYRLHIRGPVIAAGSDAAGTVTLTVRTGSLEHQLTLQATNQDVAAIANAFVYAQCGDLLSLDIRGEDARCSLCGPDGRSFTTVSHDKVEA
jgi:hypothetical protein